jgi:hypothetical protein
MRNGIEDFLPGEAGVSTCAPWCRRTRIRYLLSGRRATSTWDTLTLEDIGDGRTRVRVRSVFAGKEDRDAVLSSGMESGAKEGRPPGRPERKTGLYVSNVETTRLVRDERGWLSLVS